MNFKIRFALAIPMLLIGIFLPTPSLSQFDADSEFIDLNDVTTKLGLSAWELFVLGDLVLRMTQKQCPHVNADVLTSFKDKLAVALQVVPKSSVQNVEFLPAYSHLVQCMDFIMMKKGEIAMDEERIQAAEAEGLAHKVLEEHSLEADWISADVTVPAPTVSAPFEDEVTTEEPKNEESIFQTAINWLLKLSSIRHWIRDALRPKKDNSEIKRTIATEEETKEFRDARKQQTRSHLLVYHKSRQNVADFFHEASKLVRRSCPVVHKSEKIFMRKAFLDMTTWLTLEHHATISTSNEYFDKKNLLKQVIECNKASSSS